jgi:hypothetical protein
MRLLPLLLGLLAPAAARACEPIPAPGVYTPVDRPIAVQPDGSFWDASRDDDWMYRGGKPIVDIGGGRTGQVIGDSLGNCATEQTLLVVDCTTAEAIAVDGLPRSLTDAELIAGGVTRSTRLLQPPYGPLALTPDVTVADIATLAAREGWTMHRDVVAWAEERGPRNAFDPFRGCDLFYPESRGASR